jgi:hypothetical protein
VISRARSPCSIQSACGIATCGNTALFQPVAFFGKQALEAFEAARKPGNLKVVLRLNP